MSTLVSFVCIAENADTFHLIYFKRRTEMATAPRMSRRQRDHILAKDKYRQLVELAKTRNPKLKGEQPENWTPENAFIFGALWMADECENVAAKAHKIVTRTHASTQEGHEDLIRAASMLERLMREEMNRASSVEALRAVAEEIKK